MTSLLIAIPAMGSVASGCFISVVGAIKSLERKGIPTSLHVQNNSDIVTSRNALASAFMERDNTHLCFIDSDMSFKPHVLQRMIDENRDIIACAYPRRSDDGGFVINPSKLSVVNRGIIEADGVGMGLCLIKREVLANLAPHVRQGRPPPDLGVNQTMFGFFDQMTVGSDLMSEDFSFCRRWRTIGGTIQAIIDEDIGHIGHKTYRGQYVPQARSQRISFRMPAAKRAESED